MCLKTNLKCLNNNQNYIKLPYNERAIALKENNQNKKITKSKLDVTLKDLYGNYRIRTKLYNSE